MNQAQVQVITTDEFNRMGQGVGERVRWLEHRYPVNWIVRKIEVEVGK
jgi:hypothetical protein